MKTYLYVRVSTDSQDYIRQTNILKENGYDETNSEIMLETFSGKTKKRPVLQEMLKLVEKGDKVVITDLTRLARSVKDLWEISDEVSRKGATLVSLKENFDLQTSTGKLLFTVLGAIGQFERDTISDRTKETLRAKQKQGMILGRPLANDVEKILEMYDNGIKAKVIAEETGININTVYHHIRKERK